MQTDVLKDQVQLRERQKRRGKLQKKLLRPAHREQDHCSPHPRNLTQNVEERWRVTHRTVHNLRSKIQEEGMRSTPGCPSESDLDVVEEAMKQTTTIEQGKLAPEAAVRSSKLYHWTKQAMSRYKRGLDLAVLQEREQGGLTCGHELFRRINNLLESRLERKESLREAVMRLDVNGLKQLCTKRYRCHARIVQSFTCFTCFTRALHAADHLLQWCSAS